MADVESVVMPGIVHWQHPRCVQSAAPFRCGSRPAHTMYRLHPLLLGYLMSLLVLRVVDSRQAGFVMKRADRPQCTVYFFVYVFPSRKVGNQPAHTRFCVDHPSCGSRFLGYFPAGSSAPAVLADMLSNMFNVIGLSWDASPAATELEVLVLGEAFILT